MRYRYGQRWKGAPALTALAVLLATLVMAGCGDPSSGGARSSGTPTPTFSAYPGPRGQWVSVNGLAGGTPAIAPSDPRIIYEIFNDNWITAPGPPVLKRSGDGGATWKTLAIPGGQVKPNASSGMGLNVSVAPSPADPNLVFLTVGVPYPQSCPTWPPGAHYQTDTTNSGKSSLLSANIPASGYIQCSYEYRSADGGQTWRQVTLPAGGQLFPSPFVRPIGGSHTLYAQGGQLYSIDEGDHDELHLIRSDDGGVSWRVIDLPQAELAAGGQMFIDYMPAPGGSVVFASTSDADGTNVTIWRSDDAGASWHKVIGSIPGDRYHGMQVVSRAGNPLPLIYIAVSLQDASSPTGDAAQFDVSADGGQTWTPAPAQGLLPPADVEPSLKGVLADGSIVVEAPPPSPSGPSALLFYAWKLGQTAWRQLTPGVVSGQMLAITAPDGSGHQAIWVVGVGEGDVQRCTLA